MTNDTGVFYEEAGSDFFAIRNLVKEKLSFTERHEIAIAHTRHPEFYAALQEAFSSPIALEDMGDRMVYRLEGRFWVYFVKPGSYDDDEAVGGDSGVKPAAPTAEEVVGDQAEMSSEAAVNWSFGAVFLPRDGSGLEDLQTLMNIAQQLKPRCSLGGRKRITQLVSSQGGISNVDVWVPHTELTKIELDLYPDIDIDALAREYVESDESILILEGVPGVGKTTFLRYLCLQTKLADKRCYYIKDPAVLTSDAFWADYGTDEDNLLILDDITVTLHDRESSDDKTFVDRLLSASDNIFSSSPKIVITTNTDITKVDPAITRSGRCYDLITLNPLSQEQAQAAWATIAQKDAGDYPLADKGTDVLQSDFVREWTERTNSATPRTYRKNNQRSTPLARRAAGFATPN